ncbi:MAG: flagellar filament capping protein FliD [Candidatus Hydrogenedentes bacterium]|nr:flagellar filament capping protein FliD [Candidatus Hydrogenedentota bacterium]
MSGNINIGGLISGLDTNTIIRQLMQIERQPITRLQQRITLLQQKRTAIQNLRNVLTTFKTKLQDLKLNNIFNAFKATSSEPTVLTSQVSGANPTLGTYRVEVLQLASATLAVSSSRISNPINPTVPLENSGLSTSVTSGTFTINGVEFTIDPSTQSLNDMVNMINASSAGVTAYYDASEDRIFIYNTTPGDTTRIALGASSDTSNILSALSLTGALQYTNSNGSTELKSINTLGAVNLSKKINELNLQNGAITNGAFTINGSRININVDDDTLSDVITRINASEAGVIASYDPTTDTLRLISKELGSRLIRFGSSTDTSNFLSVMNLETANQTPGNDAKLKINGGPELTRNTNVIADAISGITITLLKEGSSTITIDTDENKVIDSIKGLINAFNDAIKQIYEVTSKDGRLYGESGIREIAFYLQQNLFNQVSDITGPYQSLADIGFTTGSVFDSKAIPSISLNEEKFKSALRNNKNNVIELFTNQNATGLVDRFLPFLDEITAYNGFLNERIKPTGSIDTQITTLNRQISAIEYRVSQREARLRRQFTLMEQMLQNLQGQNTSLTRLSNLIS